MKMIAIENGVGFKPFVKGEVYDVFDGKIIDHNGFRICHIKSVNGLAYFREYKEEECKVEFKKSDLQDGDIVVYDCGMKRVVEGCHLVDEKGRKALLLNRFNENLTHVSDSNLDIVKVTRPSMVLFERKEAVKEITMDEIAKMVGVKVENLKVVK